MLHPINVASKNNNVSHNQISAASNNTFNRTIGSRQSSPTDEVNNVGIQLHSTQGVNDKINSVNNVSNVQNSAVQNSVTKESSLISSSGPVPSENQHVSTLSVPTHQINIDTSGFPGQVFT